MDRKILLDASVHLRRLDEIKLRGGEFLQMFTFQNGGFSGGVLGPIILGPMQRLRLTLTAEPIVTDLRTLEEHALSIARELMRSNLVRLQVAGYWPKELDDLTASIDGLVRARVALALRVHCDADHDCDG